MKSLRLTPLNIACAVLLAWILWCLLYEVSSWQRLIAGFALLILMVIADQFFRLFFQRLARIWWIELGFLGFTVLVMLILGVM